MLSSKEDVLRHQLTIPYHHESPFRKERAEYLTHLLTEGWSLSSVLSKSCDLSAFTRRVDIVTSGKMGAEAIRAAARHCIVRHSHSKSLSPASLQKARSRFVYAVTEWLRFLGRLEEEPSSPPPPHSSLVREFTEFLAKERGLAEPTIRMHLKYVVWFLNWFDERQADLSKVSLADVEKFLASSQARHWNRITVRICVSALRSFFHHARTRGWCPGIFADAIEAPRQYTAQGLALGPSWTQVRQLITSIGRERPVDLRDRAILMLASTYGFRNSEIRQLRLDDLDWEHDLIQIYRSKPRRDQRYPLVKEVGEAIALYLRKGRPQSDRREVFLRQIAPFEPLTCAGLSTLVRVRMKRLDVKIHHFGPHALRHACASHLLSEGFSLKEIGDHLGHADPRSTLIYAKADLAGLRQVADFELGGLL
jgi:integrase/recombinase XerD